MNQDRLYYDCVGKILDAAQMMNAVSRNANSNIVADHEVRPHLRDIMLKATDLYAMIYDLVRRQMGDRSLKVETP